jgi:type VI secretion system secreted protein Hcp
MNIAKKIAATALALALTATTGAMAASPVAFLTSPFGYSAVLDWSLGVSNTSSVLPGAGGGAGKAEFQDVSLVRNIDAQSPLFFRAVSTGQHLGTVVIATTGLNITLTEVLISSYAIGTGDDVPTEKITMAYRKIKYTVGGVSFCFDRALALPC